MRLCQWSCREFVSILLLVEGSYVWRIMHAQTSSIQSTQSSDKVKKWKILSLLNESLSVSCMVWLLIFLDIYLSMAHCIIKFVWIGIFPLWLRSEIKYCSYRTLSFPTRIYGLHTSCLGHKSEHKKSFCNLWYRPSTQLVRSMKNGCLTL